MIRLDYSAETAEGKLYARRVRLDVVPEVGSTVETRDADGNHLFVTVDHVDDVLVHFAPIWSTWRDASDTPPAQSVDPQATRSTGSSSKLDITRAQPPPPPARPRTRQR